jgi:hypothetical protein
MARYDLLVYRRRFRAYCRAQGMRASRAGLQEQIGWLISEIRKPHPPTHETLRKMAGALRNVGRGSEQERRERYRLVYDFVRKLQGGPDLSPPRVPSRAMPQDVFRRLIFALGPPHLARLRNRAVLLLAWWVGMAACRVFQLTRDNLSFGRDFVVIRWRPVGQYRERRAKIPLAKDERLCLVRTLRQWIAAGNIEEHQLLFPTLAGQTISDKARAPNPNHIHYCIQRALARIGVAEHYDYTSIRRAHAINLKAVGEALRVYLCGYSDCAPLRRLLRAEPDWDEIPTNVIVRGSRGPRHARKKSRKRQRGTNRVDRPRADSSVGRT